MSSGQTAHFVSVVAKKASFVPSGDQSKFDAPSGGSVTGEGSPPADGTIRLSTRLQGMPSYVVDYVLLHELTHLLTPGHGPDFWEWLNRYDLTERARGFLDGLSAASGMPADDEVIEE